MATRKVLPTCPVLARVASAFEIGPIRTCVRDRPGHLRRAKLSTSTRRRDDERVQRRYGTANEPPPHLSESQIRDGRSEVREAPSAGSKTASATSAASTSSEKEEALAQSEDTKELAKDQRLDRRLDQRPAGADGDTNATVDDVKKKDATDAVPGDATTSSMGVSKSEASTAKAPQAQASTPLETVLNMPPPENMESDRLPHLHPPPYIHHFDTYGLVQRLDSGGFTSDQSTTIMKAVRTILTENMDLARRGLVSKSNVENETYLFKAACSELKTELENNRKGELDKNRTRRALLQHEADILGQRITQDASVLREELKGMFDDRKMTQRNEQRNMENRIQELNYKITVALNSDAKTEVEGVRWVLTRRAATALGVSVLMILATLNYARYMTATQEKERKLHQQLMKEVANAPAPDMVSMGTQTQSLGNSGEAMLASEGINLG